MEGGGAPNTFSAGGVQRFPSSCNIRLQEREPCHPIKLLIAEGFKFCFLIGSHCRRCCNRKLQELGKALYTYLRFRYSDQKGPDINVYNKEYFDNHSSYTFLL